MWKIQKYTESEYKLTIINNIILIILIIININNIIMKKRKINIKLLKDVPLNVLYENIDFS